MNPDFSKFLSAILECINSIKVLDDTMHANQQVLQHSLPSWKAWKVLIIN